MQYRDSHSVPLILYGCFTFHTTFLSAFCFRSSGSDTLAQNKNWREGGADWKLHAAFLHAGWLAGWLHERFGPSQCEKLLPKANQMRLGRQSETCQFSCTPSETMNIFVVHDLKYWGGRYHITNISNLRTINGLNYLNILFWFSFHFISELFVWWHSN